MMIIILRLSHFNYLLTQSLIFALFHSLYERSYSARPCVPEACSPGYIFVPRAGCPMYILGPRAVCPEYNTVPQGRLPLVHFCTQGCQPHVLFLYQGLPALGTRRYLGAVSPEVLSRKEGCQPFVKKK